MGRETVRVVKDKRTPVRAKAVAAFQLQKETYLVCAPHNEKIFILAADSLPDRTAPAE